MCCFNSVSASILVQHWLVLFCLPVAEPNNTPRLTVCSSLHTISESIRAKVKIKLLGTKSKRNRVQLTYLDLVTARSTWWLNTAIVGADYSTLLNGETARLEFTLMGTEVRQKTTVVLKLTLRRRDSKWARYYVTTVLTWLLIWEVPQT